MLISSFPRQYIYILTAYSLLALAVVAYVLNRDHEERVGNWRKRLMHISSFNQHVLESWLQERRKDVQELASLPSTREVASLNGRIGTVHKLPHLQSELDSFVGGSGDGIFVLNRVGITKALSGFSSLVPSEAREACKRQQFTRAITVLNPLEVSNYPHLAFLSPILRASRGARQEIVGCVILLTTPHRLQALELTDTGVTASGETVLIAMKGNQPIFVSPLRHSGIAKPLPSQVESGAERASTELRKPLFSEYRDYRGVPVLAVIRLVPSVDWTMVTKIDRAEALGDFQETFVQSLSIATLSIMLVVSIAVSLWRHRRVQPFREALLNSAIGVAVTNTAGKFVQVNHEFCRITGYSESEMEVLDWTGITHPDDLDRNLILGNRMLAGELASFLLEQRYITKRGETVWVRNSTSAVRNRGGKIRHVITLAEDITDRKRAEDALRLNEEWLRVATNSSNTGLWDWDPRTNDVHFSTIWKRQIGYSDDEISNRLEEWESRVHPDDLPQALAAVKAYVQNPSPAYENEFRLRHQDGSYRWILAKASLLQDEQGCPRMIGSHLDITERKRAEEALRRSEEDLRLLFEQTPDGIFIADAQGRYLDINPAGVQLLGYSRNELQRMAIGDVVAPEEIVRIAPEIARLAKGNVVRAEWRFQHKNGSIFDAAVVARQLSDGRLVVILRNISEGKHAEEAMRKQTEQLRALSARLQTVREEERRQVARDLHDQIGQILTAVKMDVDWVCKRISEEQPDLRARLESTFELLRDGTHTVRKICTELRPGVLDDLGLAAAIEWQAKDFATRTNTTCEVSVPSDDIDVDPQHATAIFRIFQEALTNIARHAAATTVRASVAHRGGRLLLVVQDNGKGISDTDSAAAQGSLGLLGMKERAQACGGHLQIWAEPGSGTTVAVDIPIRKSEKQDNHYVDLVGR